MDVLAEDQALQAMFGKELGIDNEGLDFSQLEDFINGENANVLEDAIGVLTNAHAVDHSMDLSKSNKLPGHGHHSQHGQHGQHSHIQPPVTSINSFQNTHNGFDYKNNTYQHTLPDSPPDSGSEPYSPPGSNQSNGYPHRLEPDSKVSIVSGMTSIPPPIYCPPHPPVDHSKPYQGYHEPPKLNHLPPQHPATMAQINLQSLPPHYSSMNNITGNHGNKKRKFSDSPNGTVNGNMLQQMGGYNSMVNNIKQEPGVLPDCEEDFTQDFSYDNPNMYLDGTYQVIKWQAFQPTKWVVLLEDNFRELPTPSYRVDADKGFNFAVPDDAFVCQKKNHFQVTVHVGVSGKPAYVRTPEGTKKIDNFQIHFHGIKMESVSQVIKVEQSQSDRSKKPFNPVKVELAPDQVTKVTVGRLHFSETTNNNMRKKGKPNPDQRYFMLVVALNAHCGDQSYMVAAHVSERIIVRASNPGQFDNDMEVTWQKGHTSDSVYHPGRVGINTDRPEEALQVHGNVKLTGHIIQPSDKRAKTDIKEVDSKEQLKTVQNLKVYKYRYQDEFAQHAGLSPEDVHDTGVLAQEVREVLPDAVKDTGDVVLPNGEKIESFLVVNKDRIYMEGIGAVKELCKLTDNLENRIDELEKVNTKLTKLKRYDSLKSTASGKSYSTVSTISRGSTLPKSHHRQRQHTKHLPHGTPADQEGMCSSRFIQITVIVLVMVMAFCLVSITTLYILERNKETAAHHSLISATHTGGGLPPYISTSTQRAVTTTTSTTTEATSPTSMLPTTLPPPSPAPDAPILAPPGCSGPTASLFCASSPMCCREFDSPNDPIDPVQLPVKTTTQSEVTHQSNHIPGTAEKNDTGPVIIGYIPKRPGKREPDIESEKEGPKLDDVGHGSHPNEAYNMASTTPADQIESNDIIYRRRRDEEDIKLDDLSKAGTQNASIQIIYQEQNYTIDHRYCIYNCKQSGQGSRQLNYTIPISKYFGYNSVKLVIRTAEPTFMHICGLFPASHSTSCQGADPPTTPREETPHSSTRTHEVDLPVGFFWWSSYKFRVTKTSDSPCEPHTTVTYVEYYLKFSRSC
ncbi:myelin regulatory factor isoform X3 [Lingula anatina]|uniref:Myelin regulatory factor isoform X3 n=1 Tax=Lingula anatina TaxID=7574 RepID=A0A1S3JNR6_LINAN|nr:myelin regulatory factor isoform X3 [Lingula anatina]|eukprot:XP_013412018.1 myelin regulatory factor isoform X3 [Lingula anatina]